MGIPTFFRKIINQYPQTHYWNNDEKISHLFVDFNCLIHHAIHLVPEETSADNFEKKLIQEVVKYLDKVVNQITKPSELLYLALDGPAPRAKMEQQRARRYKTVKIDQYREELNKKFGLNENNMKWDSVNISPGTRFMINLSKALTKEIKNNRFKNVKKVILSDANVPGEGEHKFMAYIKNMSSKKSGGGGENDNKKICIYGLDADLIVLALTTDLPNIIILREAQDSPIEMEKYSQIGYLYLSPYQYVDALFQSLGLATRINLGKYQLQRILYDYTFLTFFSGNDFVKKLPFLKIREKGGGGLDLLLGIYQRLLREMKEYLVLYPETRIEINYPFFKRLIAELAQVEEKELREIQKARRNQLSSDQTRVLQKEAELKNSGTKNSGTTNNTDQINFEMEKFEHTYYFNPMNPFFSVYGSKFKELDYFQPKEIWREKYYQEFFHVSAKKDPKYIEMICREYLNSLLYTLHYYLKNSPPDWHYSYPLGSAPLAVDLHAYLQTGVKSKANLEKTEFQPKNGPYTPLQQLVLITPPQKANLLLPMKYVELMTDVDSPVLFFYPVDFQLDALQGGKFIYSEPILPILEDEKVLLEIKKIKLTSSEKEQNQIKLNPFVYPTSKKK